MTSLETPDSAVPLRRTVGDHIRFTLVTGIVLVLPLIVTIWLFRLLVVPLDGFVQPLFERAIGRHIPGLGLLTLVLLFYIAGLIGRNVAGRVAFGFLESAFLHIPVARSVYHGTKELLTAFSPAGGRTRSFREVCLIEFPRPGLFAVGFVTSRVRLRRSPAAGAAEEDMRTVYVPNPPNPATGFYLLVPAAEVHAVDITVEEGLKMSVSGGIVAPAAISLRGRPPAS